MVFDAVGEILEADDGGIYRLARPAVAAGIDAPADGGAALRDGMTFRIDDRTLELDSGPVLVVLEDRLPYDYKDGLEFTITDTSGTNAPVTFELEDTAIDYDDPVPAGRVAIPFNGDTVTVDQLVAAIAAAINGVGDELITVATAVGHRITLTGDSSVVGNYLPAGEYGLAEGTVRVGFEETDSAEQVQAALVAAVNGMGTGVTATPEGTRHIDLSGATSIDLFWSPPLGPRPRWVSLNGNLRVAELTSAAWDPLNDVVFAGAQDTGVLEQVAPGQTTWTTALLGTTATGPMYMGGDGLDVGVDASDPTRTLRYSMRPGFNFMNRRAFDADNLQEDLFPADHPVSLSAGLDFEVAPLLLAGDASPDPDAPAGFLTGLNRVDSSWIFTTGIQYVVNAVDPDRLLVGLNGLYESFDRGDTIAWIDRDASPPPPAPGETPTGAGDLTALAYGGRNADGSINADVIYAARGNTIRVRAAPAAPFTGATIAGAADIVDIALDPADWRIAYAVDATRVYRTADGGTTWTDVTGALPASDVRTVEVMKQPGVFDALLVGGLGGVYRTLVLDAADERSGPWTELGAGLPSTLVSDLRYDAADDVLVAATLGRGAWTLPGAGAAVGAIGALVVEGDAGANEIRLVRNAGNPLLLDVFVDNATTIPTRTVQLSTLERIDVLGLGGDDRAIVDAAHGVIVVPGGIHYDGGDGSDALALTGAEGVAGPGAVRPGAVRRGVARTRLGWARRGPVW